MLKIVLVSLAVSAAVVVIAARVAPVRRVVGL